MEDLGQEHDSNALLKFIDSSKLSLEAVVLYNGNKHASVPTPHAVGMKESCDNMASA
jgi:hypothetical protein